MKVALVTGAGTGVGRAASISLLAAGYSVVLAGRRGEVLKTCAAEIDPGGKRTLCVPADVGDPGSVTALFQAVEERFGRLDLLFNNAGMGGLAVPLKELAFETWMAVVDANLTGTFLCTQEAFQLMKRQQPRGGRIINNGSISAHIPRPLSAPYTATKHAVTGLTKSTALEGRAHDIACGQIDIGNAATPMTERMIAGVLQPDGTKRPEPRFDVARVGDAVAHMASLPLDTNILFLTIMPTQMPFVGRG